MTSTPTASAIEDLNLRLHRAMVPQASPQLPGYDLAGGTTLEEGGAGNSVWDHVTLGDGRTALLLLDVRAPGLPPAHLLATARSALRAAAPTAATSDALLARANDALAHLHAEGSDQFVECGVVVPGDGEVRWSCAGQVQAGVLTRDGRFRALGSHGPSLGVMAGFRYDAESAEMGPGDAVLVLSGASKGLFRGAADLVAEVHGKPAGEVVGTVHRAVRKAQGEVREEVSVVYLRRA